MKEPWQPDFCQAPLLYLSRACIHDWPIMFVISYIFAFFVTKAAIKIAKAAVGELKSPHSPQNAQA